MITKRPSWRPPLAITAVAMALTGCSVMQIDVDVYKGPLANHKDVHTEQVAVMAVGAEPLVKRLRGDLAFQCEETKEKARKAKNKEAEKVRLAKAANKQADACFQTEVVDGILNLFKDRADLGPAGRLLSLTEQVEAAARRLEGAGAVLNPREPSDPLNKLRDALDSRKPLNDWSDRLAKGYFDFLALRWPKFREWGNVFGVLRTALPEEEKNRLLLPYGLSAEKLPDDRIDEETKSSVTPTLSSSNLAYEILGNDAFLQAQATVLFPNDAALRALFVHEVGRIGRSFATARQAMHEILLKTLEGLTLAGRVQFVSPGAEQNIIEQAAKFVAEELIQPDHLRLALQKGRFGIAQQYLTDALNKRMAQKQNAVRKQVAQLQKADNDLLQEALTELLIKEPPATSQMLLALDPQTTGGLGSAVFVENDRKFDQPERWRYGLAAGPDEDAFRKIPAATKIIGKEVRQGVRFFEEGRFTAGIFTLIQEYLAQLQQDTIEPCGVGPLCEDGPTELETKRELLLTALVQFAEKILFVVNNEVLFDDSTLFTGISESLSLGKLKDQDYIRVLQTVGNSMLVHVDAIRQESAHERRLVRGTDREVEAITQVFGGGATLAFAQITQSLKERIEVQHAEVAAQTEASEKAAKEVKMAKAEIDTQTALVEATKPTGSEPTPTDAMTSLRAAWQSLGQDPKVLNSSAGSSDEKDKAVKTKIDALVNNASVQAAQLYDAIKDLLKAEVLAEVASATTLTPRLTRLNLAVGLFEDTDFKGKIPSATKAEQRKKIEDLVKSDFLAEKLKFLNANKAYFTALDANDRAQKALDAASEAGENAKNAGTEAKKAKDAAQDELARLKKAKDIIEPVQGKVIEKAESSAERPIGRAVYTELVKHLRTEAAKPENATKKLDLEAAATVAERLPIPLVTPSGYAVDAKDAKEVLDGLIASLRQLHTRTQLENNAGENNKAIARAAAALAEAYRQRADMVYIRPAMAYLRTSFTATTLQDNHLAWRNLLTHHGYRATVPILPTYRAKERAKVATEIDKQFWHSVNRVRVAGAGDTNYAIAKDDLGNWYVKSYSTDPKDIIKSAKNLALFAAGPSLGVPIPLDVETAPAPSANPDGTTPAAGLVDPDADSGAKKPDPSKSVFVRQFEQFREKFRQESKNDIAAAKEAAGSFKERIEKDWEDRDLEQLTIDNISAILDFGEKEPINTKLVKLDLEKVEAKAAPRKLAQALSAIRDYHLRVTQALKNNGGLSEDDRKRAAGSVTDIVLRSELKRLIERAERNMERYAVELEIIGQTGTDLDISEINDEG